MEIGFILIDNITNKIDLNKIKLMNSINEYNKKKNLMIDNEKKKIEKYNNNYVIPRKNNEDNYQQYLISYKTKYDKWNKSKNVKDLFELVSIKKPIFEDVPDIYSYNK